jgi:hypothetical protein
MNLYLAIWLTILLYIQLMPSIAVRTRMRWMHSIALFTLSPRTWIFLTFYQKRKKDVPALLWWSLGMLTKLVWLLGLMSRIKTAQELRLKFYHDLILRVQVSQCFERYNDDDISVAWRDVHRLIRNYYWLATVCAHDRLIPTYIMQTDKMLWGELGMAVKAIVRNTPATMKRTPFWEQIRNQYRKMFYRVDIETIFA